MSNDYALEKIPQDQKRGWVSMFSVLVAIGVDLSSVLLGSELAASMSTKDAILAVLVGSFLMAILYTACALVGSSTSLSTSMITKYVFGEVGAKIFSLVIGISLLGWFGVQVGFFAENAQLVLSEIFNIDISVSILSLIGGLLMMSTAIIGYSAMEKLSVYSVPFLLILMMVTLFMAVSKNSLPTDEVIQNSMTFAQGVSLAMSIGIVGAIISPDISRWSKTKKDCILSSFFGMVFGNSFMIIVSIILVKVMKTDDIMGIFMILGLAIPGILILTLAQWTTNTSNVYSSALSISLVFKKISIKKLTIILGLIATSLAVMGIYNNFFVFLDILGIIVAPVAGVYVSEFFIVKKEINEDMKLTNHKKVVIRSIIAWIVGIIVTYMSYMGIINLTTISTLDGFIIGFMSQAILSKVKVFNTNDKLKESTN